MHNDKKSVEGRPEQVRLEVGIKKCRVSVGGVCSFLPSFVPPLPSSFLSFFLSFLPCLFLPSVILPGAWRKGRFAVERKERSLEGSTDFQLKLEMSDAK